MFRLLILIFFLSLSTCFFAQEEKTFEPRLVREITPEKRVESFIEIRDSVIAFIEILKERWGEENDQDGKIIWNNVSIDSIAGKIQVQLLHTILKPGESFYKTISISKKTKANEVRVIRLRFMQKDRDLLSSQQNTQYIKDFILNLYNEIVNDSSTEDDD